MTDPTSTQEQDPLDHRLRGWAEAGLRATPAVPLPAVRRERRWTAGLAVAAAVAVLILVVAVVTSRDRTQIASPPPATPVESVTPTTGPVEPLQQVTFRELLVEVPASWSLGAAQCGVAVQDTVIRDQVAPACYQALDPDLTVVQFWDNSHGGPNGHQVPYSLPGVHALEVRRYDRSEPTTEMTTIVIPQWATSVTITSPDRQKVDTILATLRLVGPDLPSAVASTSSASPTP